MRPDAARRPTGRDTTAATPSTSKIERELGWRASESFESGLAKTVSWYLDNRPWWEAILQRGYQAERIGTAQSAARKS
jgi:dTDP-glucose 4,6-dehydratase